jgi:uncharacterized protein YegP (UPF0339 family)
MTVGFEVYQRGDEYRWRLTANRRKIAAFGAGKRTRDAAHRDIEAVKLLIAEATITDTTGTAGPTGKLASARSPRATR